MRWTVRVAIALYLLRVWLMLRSPKRSTPSAAEAWCWTIGCVSYLLHVFLAFDSTHDWSHANAWQHTAQETARISGIQRGDGVWVNYLFTGIWLADLVRVWRARRLNRETNRNVDLAIQWFFAFIVFNATVVFGQSMYRWLSIPVIAALLWENSRSRRTQSDISRDQMSLE